MYITKRSIVQLDRVRLHTLVVFSVCVLALLGHMLDSQAGWITEVHFALGASWPLAKHGPAS